VSLGINFLSNVESLTFISFLVLDKSRRKMACDVKTLFLKKETKVSKSATSKLPA